MKSGQQYFTSQKRAPECCFVQFFSQNSQQGSVQKRNSSGLINPYKTNKSILEQNEIVFSNTLLKPQIQTSKRSISSMKLKKRTTNRNSYETQNINLQDKDNIIEKVRSPMRGSEILQRYYSPKAQIVNNMAASQLEDKKKIDAYLSIQNQQGKISFEPGKQRTFFKQQKNFQSIQFTRSGRPSNNSGVSTLPANNINFNFVQSDKTQKCNPNPQIISNNNNLDKSQKINNAQKQQVYVQPQIQIKSETTLKSSETLIKKDNPEQNPNNLKHMNSIQTLKESLKIKKSAAQNVLKLEKKQNKKEEAYLQLPINPFQHIESFVVQVKKQKGSDQDQQKQYDSIKTKGRPVQSMMQITKDLEKTRKPKKSGKKQRQTGLNDLQNITVTSQFDEQQDRQRVQRIEESAVLLNFFNPPTHLKDRLQLSRSNRALLNQKSGFY